MKYILLIFFFSFYFISVCWAQGTEELYKQGNIINVFCLFEAFGEGTCKDIKEIKQYTTTGYPYAWTMIYNKKDNQIKQYTTTGYPYAWTMIYELIF